MNKKIIIAIGALLASGQALAHSQDFSLNMLWHHLTEPDHLAFIALAVVTATAVIKYKVKKNRQRKIDSKTSTSEYNKESL